MPDNNDLDRKRINTYLALIKTGITKAAVQSETIRRDKATCLKELRKTKTIPPEIIRLVTFMSNRTNFKDWQGDLPTDDATFHPLYSYLLKTKDQYILYQRLQRGIKSFKKIIQTNTIKALDAKDYDKYLGVSNRVEENFNRLVELIATQLQLLSKISDQNLLYLVELYDQEQALSIRIQSLAEDSLDLASKKPTFIGCLFASISICALCSILRAVSPPVNQFSDLLTVGLLEATPLAASAGIMYLNRYRLERTLQRFVAIISEL